MFDFVSLGTMLVDFTPVENDAHKNILVQHVGGAATNAAVALSRLGMKTAFIGKTGDDRFGHFAKSVLESENIDISNLIFDSSHQTPLAFIDAHKRGVDKYTFYRKDSADMFLKYSEVNKKLIDDCKVFHFGSLTLTHEPSYEATVESVKYAKSHGRIITYDPNFRPALWESREEAFRKLNKLVKYCDIIKFSDFEFQFMTNSDYLIRGVAELLKIGVKIILISQGANGCIVASRKGIQQIPTHKIDVVDTTGAGDAFFGAFIYKILTGNKEIEEYSNEELCAFARFANAGAAICSTAYGAVTAMADADKINKFIEENKL
ncbi:MAG: carbohydrate kinase [Oscillospiraceae bacterium]